MYALKEHTTKLAHSNMKPVTFQFIYGLNKAANMFSLFIFLISAPSLFFKQNVIL